MPFEEDKVPLKWADLFRHSDDGRGLTDEEYDAQKARLQAEGIWPLDEDNED